MAQGQTIDSLGEVRSWRNQVGHCKAAHECTGHYYWPLLSDGRWIGGTGTDRGGFPNRRTTLPGNLALIWQNLSLTAFTFSEL